MMLLAEIYNMINAMEKTKDDWMIFHDLEIPVQAAPFYLMSLSF
jgi:hypothetical protein